MSPSGSVQPGELPSELLLGEPRGSPLGPPSGGSVIPTFFRQTDIALAWSSEGAFTGSIVAQEEFSLDLATGAAFTLPHNGAPVFYRHDAVFELRYADGFFLITAQQDNVDEFGELFALDIYPPDVPRQPPIGGVPPCPGDGVEVCSNGLGFIKRSLWPSVAGKSRSLLIARPDPTDLTYTALITPNPSCEAPIARRLPDTRAQYAVMERGGPVWQFDFQTARVRVQGCNASNACVESAEQPLQAALVDGVIAIKPAGEASNAHVALAATAVWLAVSTVFNQPAGGSIIDGIASLPLRKPGARIRPHVCAERRRHHAGGGSLCVRRGHAGVRRQLGVRVSRRR